MFVTVSHLFRPVYKNFLTKVLFLRSQKSCANIPEYIQFIGNYTGEVAFKDDVRRLTIKYV